MIMSVCFSQIHVIHVKVSSDSRCSRTLPVNVAIIVVVREILARIGLG